MRYKHVVFDLDGTLFDTEYSALHSLQDAVKAVTGAAPPLDSLRFSIGLPGRNTLERLGVPDVEQALALWEASTCNYEDTVRLFDGVAALLAALADGGCGLGVATSRTRAECDHDLVRFDVARRFPVIVSTDDTVRHKPAPDSLFKYMELTGASRGELLYVGDSSYDCGCAAAAGVHFMQAGWGNPVRLENVRYFPKTPLEALSYIE